MTKLATHNDFKSATYNCVKPVTDYDLTPATLDFKTPWIYANPFWQDIRETEQRGLLGESVNYHNC
ncbi:MAG: hypothetical protein IMY82_05180 [Chloroflexi bacterium]|nr:hypothetical protein [Chloroflexota bacterium]